MTNEEKYAYLILCGWISVYHSHCSIEGNWYYKCEDKGKVLYAFENAYLTQIDSPDFEFELSRQKDD